jgi:hypothetical protein
MRGQGGAAARARGARGGAPEEATRGAAARRAARARGRPRRARRGRAAGAAAAAAAQTGARWSRILQHTRSSSGVGATTRGVLRCWQTSAQPAQDFSVAATSATLTVAITPSLLLCMCQGLQGHDNTAALHWPQRDQQESLIDLLISRLCISLCQCTHVQG